MLIDGEDPISEHPEIREALKHWAERGEMLGLLWWTAIEAQKVKRTGEGRVRLWTLGKLLERVGKRLMEASEEKSR